MTGSGAAVVHRFDDGESLAAALAADLVERLAAGVAARGVASWAVSGGSTPGPLFRRVARAELDWSRVTITLVDERWVDVRDSASNEAMVRRELLTGPAAAARFVGLYTGGDDPFAAVADVDARVAEVPQPFDVAVLGMGDDGHTASWFPGGEGLAAALDQSTPTRCVAVRPTFATPPRMTWCRGPIVAARHLVLHIVGANKWAVFERAQATGPVAELPVRAVLSGRVEPLAVYWAPR